MNGIAAAVLLATALLSGSDEDVVQRTHAHVVGDDVMAATCAEVFAGIAEPGHALFDFRYERTGERRPDTARYTGKITFSLGEVTIHVPKSIGWKGMSRGDRARADALRRAILHHEVGHVRIAEAVRDALNANSSITAPDAFAFAAAADAAGRDGFERFKREQRAYDELTGHGRTQHLAPGALAGTDTVLDCRGPGSAGVTALQDLVR